ncbi:hypothetical protein HPB51_005900 [Rhipicephalus microplus]|uniref:Uncharacterized protein n=1 Tax=Rhipicephalus microplus TaxID=6941 RepID=A0A9J6D478_RHIMP|nr:hypothetical protein HPB51_005900 [Rhipicephalus microplus]
MSGSPSRPTPPSRPQSISHEGITISGVCVAPVLQGTCSQDHWLVTGRPHLGGYMSPGGSFALSASTSRSSGSAAAVHGTREKGRADMAAQDKIHSSGSRSPPTPEQSGSKIPTWRSFSAGSCNWSFNAQLRPSRREVRDGSEFKFSLRSSKSPSSSSDGSLHYSMLAPDDASIPRNQDSMVSVQLRSPKSPSGSVEYACTASPSRTANVLPGSPLRRTALDTKVSTRVTTTTVAWTPPAHAIGLTPRRSSVSGMSSREMLKIDKQEEQRRRSVTFTGAPLMAAVPENSLREVTTISSTVPESKSGPPQEQSEFPVPKTMELQNLEPRLGPPEKEDKEAERVSSVDVRLKPGSEPSESFQDIGAPKEPVKSEGLQATSKRHWRSTAGHTPSVALVLKDESEQNTTLGAARPQPAPAGVSVAKEVSPAEVSDEDNSAPIATMNIDVPISKPDYQPSVLLSESGRNETEATEMTVAAPPLPADHLESQREEKRKRDASALVEIDKEDRSIRAAQDAEGFLLSTGTLFGPEEHVITDDVKATLSPTTVIETPPSNQRLKSGEGVETMKRADTKAFGSRDFEEGSTRPEKCESDELAEDTNVEEIFAEAETYLHGSKTEERTKRQSHERATFSEQEPQAEPKTTISDEIQAQHGAPATAPVVDRRENRGDAQAAAGRHLEQAGSAVQVYEGTQTKSAQDSDTVPEQVEATQASVQTKIAPEALPYDEVRASSPVDLVIEENRVSGERTVAAGPRELEAKTDIQLPEITYELPIRPRTTGGSLEGESRMTDPAKRNRTKSREECSLARSFDKSGETRTLGEVSQAQKEIKPIEVLEIPTEETAAATEARDKFPSPIEADSAAQTVRPKPITDIRSPGIEDEHSMHSRPMGGLFERGRIIAETVERALLKEDSSIIENAKNGETNAVMGGSEEAKDAMDGSDAEPYYLFQMPEEKRAFVEVGELQRGGRRTPATLVRRSLGGSTAAEDAGGRDAKAGRQRRSIIARISLGPMVTGGLLEKESRISEHVKSDEAITPATILTEPCTLSHTHGEFVTSVEAHKPTEIKAVEDIPALIEATSSAAEAVPEVACEAPTETHLSELSKSVAKVDDEGHVYGEELFLNPRVPGGLLDVVQVVPQSRSALVDEPSIVSRMKPSGAAVSPRVLPEEFLWTYPMVTGGLLELDDFMCGGASGPEKKTPMSCEKRERDKSSLKDFIATERTVSAHQTSTSHVGERALAGPAGPAVAPCTSDTDVCGILAEKLAPAHYAQVTPLSSSRELSDDRSKTQPAKTPGGVELPKSCSGAAFNTDTPFAFSAAKRFLIDTSSEIQLPSSALKPTLSWTLVQDIFNTSTRTEEKPAYIDSRIPFCGTPYDADFTYRASTSSKATDEITNPKEKVSVTPQNPLEVELGFVPTTGMNMAVKDKSSHSDFLSTPVEQHLPSVERGILPAVSSEHYHSSDRRPLDNTREQMPERKETIKESEEGGEKAKPEEAEDVSYKSNEQVGSEKALCSPAFHKLDSDSSALSDGSVDVRTSATSLEHNLPTFDEHRVQSDVAATERTLHTAHEAGMVEARNADERLEMASEQQHASDETTTEEKVPLALTQDMHPVISETIAQHEHSSSLSTTSENDKPNLPAESEDLRPEGIPDPVASLVAFFEQRDSAQTTDRKPNIPSDESNSTEHLEKERHLSESKGEPETYTAIHSKESIVARADAWASPPLVTEKCALPENASAASNEGGILEVNKSTEEIPQAEETHKTEAPEIATDANTPPKVVEVVMTGTELHEDKSDSSAKVPSSKEVEGRQSSPAVAEEDALPVAVRAEHKKDKALAGCGKVQHTGGYNRITKAVPSIAEEKRSREDKDVHMMNAEESKMKPTPSAEAESMQKLGGSQSPPVVTEERALPDDATAVPPKHGEQEGLGATVNMKHTGEERYMIKKMPTAAESKQYHGDRDSNLTSTKVSEKKPHSSEKGQHLKGPQSSRELTKEDAHPEVARVVPAGRNYERDKKGQNTGEENSATVALPSAVSGENNQEVSRTESVLRKPPILGRDESALVVEGWQHTSAAIEKYALSDDQSSTHKDLQHQSLSSAEWPNKNVMTETEAATDERIIGESKESPSYSRLLKTKNKVQEEHSGTVSQARTFKFTTPTGTLDYSMMNDLNTGVVFTTIKSASSYTGSPRRRKEKADNADEEFVYLSSGSSSPRGELTSLKKRSSCRLVRIADDCGNEISPTTANSPPGSPAKQYFKAFFQQGQAALYTGDLTKPHAPSKLTNRLTSNISCNDDSSPSHRSEKKKTGRDEQDAQTRDPYDESAHPSRSSLPSERKENVESDISKSRLLREHYAHSAVWPPKISPPHHDTKVLSILRCKLCGQSVFRGNPTHAEMCSSYHRDSAVPPATSGVPPTPQFLEQYVLSVVDEDDVSDVLRQAWRDGDTAILAPSVWSLYHCAPSFFYIIREKAIPPSSRGEVCASACIITFGDEVSFCGFFHISRERDNSGLSRTLWNRMLDACQGKNVCSAMPQARALPFLRRYHFLVSCWGDIVYCHVTLRGGSFPAPSASRDSLLVRDLDLKRDSEAVIEYDHGVFGFDRSYYLRVALAEKEQTVKVATVASSEGHVTVAGYVGVQADERGRPALRWLFADGDEVALALMHAVVEACPKIREKGLVGAFYAASHATGVILNSVNKKFMEPWILLYNTREPFLRYDKIVSLTLI